MGMPLFYIVYHRDLMDSEALAVVMMSMTFDISLNLLPDA